LDTLAYGAESPPPSPHYFPPGEKLVKKWALTESTDLSVFDILNIFQHCWFLSQNHLRAQKAKDRNIFWVKFSPQFHTHLVKCTVALVLSPIQKVKKVMFGFILELLNGESPQAFFNLSKGDWWATTA
jgi:acyl-CoA thioesterase